MNCVEFWNPENPPEGNPRANDHLAECPACATRWAKERALAGGMRLLAADFSPVEAPPRVEAGLVAAFRVQQGFKRNRPIRVSHWAPVFLWAAAAVATILMATVLIRGWRPTISFPSPTASPLQKSQPVVESASDMDEDNFNLGSDFILVPNAARIEPNEDVNVVRMEVTRSAMMALGISVNSESDSDKVVADVVLGSDGMARAVRVVSDGTDLEL